ncbi:MAG TPA: GIY-YIG nuclease family protein [Flavobacteriales bacterium]|nr:GIY-YIG nuclease family protein [Flavobacteriales bacterium]
MFYVYILESEINGSYYKGHTNDLDDRVRRHNNGEELSTARYAPWKLVWFCKKQTKSEAVVLEAKLKNLSAKRLRAFIQKYPGDSGPDDTDKAH